jgi:hypothetical protein
MVRQRKLTVRVQLITGSWPDSPVPIYSPRLELQGRYSRFCSKCMATRTETSNHLRRRPRVRGLLWRATLAAVGCLQTFTRSFGAGQRGMGYTLHQQSKTVKRNLLSMGFEAKKQRRGVELYGLRLKRRDES